MSTPLAARHRLAVAVLTAVPAAAYVTYGLVQYATFRVGTFDLVIFDQAVRSYAHLQLGVSPVKGVQDGFGPAFSVLGDHWSPVIAVLAPLYWIYDGPQDLLVAQGVLFALAVPPLWFFTRRICAASISGAPAPGAPAVSGSGAPAAPVSRGPVVAACLVAAAYALSWPIAAAVATGFHEVAFVPVLTAIFFERLAAGRIRTAVAAALALLLVKEDMGLLVAGFGLFLLAARGPRFSRWAPGHPLAGRHRVTLGAGLVAGGIAAMLLATYVLRPVFGGRAGYYWAYWSLGGNARLAAAHALRDPLTAARLAVTPSVKLTTMMLLAGVLLLLPLLSPITLAALPLLAERMLASSQPNWWGTTFQYNAFVEMVLVCAAADGAARIAGWAARSQRTAVRRGRPGRAGTGRGGTGRWGAGRWQVVVTALVCATAVAVLPRFALASLASPGFYDRDRQMQAEAAADATVPRGVTVDAAQMLGPQLSGRDTVLLWGPAATSAAWIVAQADYTYPFRSLPGQRAQIGDLERRGYQVTFRRDGYLVLHRPPGRPGHKPGAGAPGPDARALAWGACRPL
jgi:uncharacterized membrane protein